MREWTHYEEEQLLKLVKKKDLTWHQIGKLLGRTKWSCKQKMITLQGTIHERKPQEKRMETAKE